MTIETWKRVPGMRDVFASSRGRIKHGNKVLRQRAFNHSPGYKYPYVRLHNRTTKVAPLVCKAFHGPPEPPWVFTLHKDDDAFNNTPTNLYWGTRRNNGADAVRNGRYMARATLTPDIVRTCRARYVPYDPRHGIRAMAREYGVSQQTMCDAVRGINWQHVRALSS